MLKKKHELLCKDHDHCEITLADDEDKILTHEIGTKPLKFPYTMYLDLEVFNQNMNDVLMIQINHTHNL